ncbi:serine hydrolase domain-containing protein [Anoxynatronum buryatiense]|uniref:CubicO group peptidase, beta-lactamase class C family n=1 Tax=Anoxynatronum buryatiense TaxID=489973 RepID=A0AA45WSK0_9CLOT|nr:serine hydrolase domain-containing protein [Anoxynatronum buryatiense]SMP37976.1 CubicO group peptidase, beta-lactamase class C family [Anoxynatronum buryatiense]
MKTMQDNIVKEIDQMIKDQMYYRDIPGLSIGIVLNHELKLQKGYGWADYALNKEMSADAIFHMASISKLFTATAVMQLVEQRVLDLNKPFIRYLPDFKPEQPMVNEITLKQMLSHTSGMPDCDDYEWELAREDEAALHEYVMSQTDISLVSQPGERFNYSNIAYEILGDIVRYQSGISFDDYCWQYLLNPLEMKSSHFIMKMVDQQRLVSPHIKDDDNKIRVSPVFPYNRAHGPSSTLYSTVEELSRFACSMMTLWQRKHSPVLKYNTLMTMLTPEAKIKEEEQIGLGWFISQYDQQTFYGHEGNDIGFRTTFAMIPSKGLAIIVLANLQTASTRKIMRGIYDIIS